MTKDRAQKIVAEIREVLVRNNAAIVGVLVETGENAEIEIVDAESIARPGWKEHADNVLWDYDDFFFVQGVK